MWPFKRKPTIEPSRVAGIRTDRQLVRDTADKMRAKAGLEPVQWPE